MKKPTTTMKVQFCGSSAVDIDGHTNVEPGAVIEVPVELGEQLLFAGSSVDADGTVTSPETPTWRHAGKGTTQDATPATTTDPTTTTGNGEAPAAPADPEAKD